MHLVLTHANLELFACYSSPRLYHILSNSDANRNIKQYLDVISISINPSICEKLYDNCSSTKYIRKDPIYYFEGHHDGREVFNPQVHLIESDLFNSFQRKSLKTSSLMTG